MSDNEYPVDILTDRLDELTCETCNSVLDISAVDPFEVIECPACSAELIVPAKLGPFRLLKLLGTGGMGAVYHGIDDSLGRDVAIKVMLKSLGDDEEAVTAFKTEARMAAALNHPNVAQIYSCGQEKGQPYIAMEMVPGESLDDMIHSGKPLSEAVVIKIAADTARGLSAGAEIGLIHGDVKPKNILMDEKHNAKIVDFGLASFVNRHAEIHGVWGTPYYVAPEKVRKQPADTRSDIYSLGATVYHALAGRPPFQGETPIEVVKARLGKMPKRLSTVRHGILQATERVVMRMLAEDPARRYPNYDSLLSDLRSVHEAAAAKDGSGRLHGSKVMIKKKGTVVATKTQIPDIPPQSEPGSTPTTKKKGSGILTCAIVAIVFMLITAVAIIGTAVALHKKAQQELAQIQELQASIDTEYAGTVGRSSVYRTQPAQARQTIAAMKARYDENNKLRASILAKNALKLADAAVAEAGALEDTMAKLGAEKSALDNATDFNTATLHYNAYRDLETEVHGHLSEIRRLLAKAEDVAQDAQRAAED